MKFRIFGLVVIAAFAVSCLLASAQSSEAGHCTAAGPGYTCTTEEAPKEPEYDLAENAWACPTPSGIVALRKFGPDATASQMEEGSNTPPEYANQKLSKFYDCTSGALRELGPAPFPFRVMQRDGPFVWICQRIDGSGWAPKTPFLSCFYAFADGLVDHVTGTSVHDPIIADHLP